MGSIPTAPANFSKQIPGNVPRRRQTLQRSVGGFDSYSGCQLNGGIRIVAITSVCGTEEASSILVYHPNFRVALGCATLLVSIGWVK